ncbi:hypothetical protein [Streptomyces sp. NPDC057702]|uniref:hypothetical protein n=1 Tax=unclassified Streptomyces TaxID=2593676 RepID=UPI0036CA23CE
MVRFVHKQRAYAGVMAASAAGTAALGHLVTGSPDMPNGKVAAVVIGAVALWVLLLRVEPRRWSDVAAFEGAATLADPDGVLAGHTASLTELRRLYAGMLAFWVVFGTALAAFEPLTAFLILLLSPAPLLRAERAARWERQHGVLLWQGHVDQEHQPRGGHGQAPLFTSPHHTRPHPTPEASRRASDAPDA